LKWIDIVISNKVCPCCGKKFSFFAYLSPPRDLNESLNHIRCQYCNNIILLDNRKQPIRDVSILIITITILYLLVSQKFSWYSIPVALIFLLFSSYIAFRSEKLNCYTEKEIKENEIQYDAENAKISLWIFGFFLIIIFGVILYFI